ncbi:MAG: LuxR C-terminal-related transcriptional regulator [Dehalococcoidia bacterium]
MGRRGRPPYPDVLTPREWEVHALLREGLSNEEIAERLGISLAGAKYHVSEILSKLGVASREEAAAIEPERRRWWLAALAPAGLLGKKASFAVAGLAAIAVAAGIGVLLWGLLRTEGGEGSTSVVPPNVAAPVEPIVLGEGLPGGVDWSPSGSSVAYIVGAQLFRADAPAFDPQLLLTADGEYGTAIRDPRWSPDGARIAFVGSHEFVYPNGEQGALDTIWVVGADGTGLIDLLPGDRAYLSTGIAGKTMQDWLDDKTIAFAQHCGAPCEAPLTLNVESGDLANAATLNADPGNLDPSEDVFGTGYYYSQDQRWLAADGFMDIAVYDRVNHVRANIESPPGTQWLGRVLAWSPDSSAFLYQQDNGADQPPPPTLYTYDIASGASYLVVASPGWAGAWSPDGSLIAFLTEATPEASCGDAPVCIAVVYAASGEDRYRVAGPGGDALEDPPAESGLQFLPDDRLICYDRGGSVWLAGEGARTRLYEGDTIRSLSPSSGGDYAVVEEIGRLLLLPIPPP